MLCKMTNYFGLNYMDPFARDIGVNTPPKGSLLL